MTDKPGCTHIELIARVVALEAIAAAERELSKERDLRYGQRADSQDKSVAVAMASAEKAILKAEMATEKRLEGLNELKGMAENQARTFARSEEVKLVQQSMDKRIDVMSGILERHAARGGGIADVIGYLVGAAGLGLAALAHFYR